MGLSTPGFSEAYYEGLFKELRIALEFPGADVEDSAISSPDTETLKANADIPVRVIGDIPVDQRYVNQYIGGIGVGNYVPSTIRPEQAPRDGSI